MAARSPRAAADTAAPDPDTEAPGWFRFIGPYPIVLMDRALDVAPGDKVLGPVPDDVNWEPTEAPTTTSEES